MIKSSFKNFFKNIWLVLVIAGIIGLSAGAVILTVYLRFDAVGDARVFSELGSAFYYSTRGMTIMDWLGGGVITVLRNFAGYSNENLEITFSNLLGTIIIGAIIVLIFTQIAGLVSRMIIKRKLKRKDTMHWFPAFIIKFLISLGFSTLFTVLVFFLAWLIFPLLFLWFFLGAVKNICIVRTIYFRDRKLKELLTVKTIFAYLFASLLLILVIAAIIVPIAIWGNFWIAMIITIPLFIYVNVTIELTTTAHFMEVFNKTE